VLIQDVLDQLKQLNLLDEKKVMLKNLIDERIDCPEYTDGQDKRKLKQIKKSLKVTKTKNSQPTETVDSQNSK